VYLATRGWPRDELYGLTSQARRPAVSIPENIAGLAAAVSPIETKRFTQIALGSA